MRTCRRVTLSLSVAILRGACAGQRTEVIAAADPAASFQAYKTYAFVPADRLDKTGSQMGDPVTRQNLEGAIGRGLQAKGLSSVSGDTKPSLLVSYFADVHEGQVATSALRDSWERQGFLAIDLVDPTKDLVVWHGEAWARDPDFKIAEQIVADLLRKYPLAP